MASCSISDPLLIRESLGRDRETVNSPITAVSDETIAPRRAGAFRVRFGGSRVPPSPFPRSPRRAVSSEPVGVSRGVVFDSRRSLPRSLRFSWSWAQPGQDVCPGPPVRGDSPQGRPQRRAAASCSSPVSWSFAQLGRAVCFQALTRLSFPVSRIFL